MKIAIQGIQGCFHQIAANNYFNQQVDVLCCDSFLILVNEVVEGKNCDLGVMAIENSIAGSILQNYKLLQQSGLNIIGETYLPIVQNLIAFPGTKIEDITEVYSHPMAIYQCYDYLNTLDNVKLIEKEDTAGSVKEIRDNNLRNKAAISSDLSAVLYDMEVIAPSIETNKENYTRFLIVSKSKLDQPENTNKASLYFSVSHSTGSLAQILTEIAAYNINISKLQSYPIIGKNWQYYFYVDIEYNSYQDYEIMLEKISEKTTELKVLGNYKNGKQ